MSHTLSGCISTASFLYCLLISSSEASLGTPRTLQNYKPPIAIKSLFALFIVSTLFYFGDGNERMDGRENGGMDECEVHAENKQTHIASHCHT